MRKFLTLIATTVTATDLLSDFEQALKEFKIDISIYTSKELQAYKNNFEKQIRDVKQNLDTTTSFYDLLKQIITSDAIPVQTEASVFQLQQELKNKQEPWVAELSSRWINQDTNGILSIKEAKHMQGTFIGDQAQQLPDIYDHRNMTSPTSELPDNFDSRAQWGANCPSLHHIRNQAACGSCWAHGSTESYNDRLCIATGKKELLSTEHTTSCCGFFPCMSMGCNGGHPGLAWRWLVKGGVVTGGDYGDSSLNPINGGGCWPYQVDPKSHSEGATPACRSSCLNSDYETKYQSFDKDKVNHRGGRAYMLHGIDAIRENILKFGSIASAFIVYSDFMSYKGGIYTGPATGATVMGGHAIKIVGWGKDEASGLNYWIVANSWGTSWGEGGFFKIQWHSKTMMDWGCSAGEIEEGSFGVGNLRGHGEVYV